MRRKEREVKERAAIEEILRACKVCRLAMNGEDGVPYVVPLNFGYTWSGEQPVFYLHSAQSGRKLDLLGKDARVCFEMDCDYVLEGEADDACTYTNATPRSSAQAGASWSPRTRKRKLACAA